MGQVVQTNGHYEIRTAEGSDILLNTGPNAGNVRVTGNLIVTGDTLTVSAENLNVQDNIIVLNFGETGAGVSLEYSGIQIDRGTETPVSILYDEASDSWMLARGTPESSFNFSSSGLRLQKILTDQDTVLTETGRTGDLNLIGYGTGVISVAGTYTGPGDAGYETRVTQDDDIPNKKYVDDAIQGNPTFQILKGDTRVISFDSSDPLDISLFPIGPYNTNPVASEIAVIVDNRRVANFTKETFEMRGLTIFAESPLAGDIFGAPFSPAVVIQATNTGSNLLLETNDTGKVEISYAMQFNDTGIPVVAPDVSDSVRRFVYAYELGAGTSGLYVANNGYQDELVLKNRAILFSMLF